MAKKFLETDTDISGLTVVKRMPVSDNRGLFERVLCINEISSWRDRSVKQINRSVTKLKGVIRGLHFQQKPYSECKLVTCLKGSVMDVYDYLQDIKEGNSTTVSQKAESMLDFLDSTRMRGW